jgi:hypothetical protein
MWGMWGSVGKCGERGIISLSETDLDMSTNTSMRERKKEILERNFPDIDVRETQEFSG